MGASLIAMGQNQEAAKVLRKGSRLDGNGLRDRPAHDNARMASLLQLGSLYTQQGKLQRALAVYREALHSHPSRYPLQVRPLLPRQILCGALRGKTVIINSNSSSHYYGITVHEEEIQRILLVYATIHRLLADVITKINSRRRCQNGFFVPSLIHILYHLPPTTITTAPFLGGSVIYNTQRKLDGGGSGRRFYVSTPYFIRSPAYDLWGQLTDINFQ